MNKTVDSVASFISQVGLPEFLLLATICCLAWLVRRSLSKQEARIAALEGEVKSCHEAREKALIDNQKFIEELNSALAREAALTDEVRASQVREGALNHVIKMLEGRIKND